MAQPERFGIEDELYGENVAIALVLKNQDPKALADVHQWIAGHLTEYKRPVRWFLLDEIPRTSRGKINRDVVRKLCSGQTPVNLNRVLRDLRPARS